MTFEIVDKSGMGGGGKFMIFLVIVVLIGINVASVMHYKGKINFKNSFRASLAKSLGKSFKKQMESEFNRKLEVEKESVKLAL